MSKSAYFERFSTKRKDFYCESTFVFRFSFLERSVFFVQVLPRIFYTQPKHEREYLLQFPKETSNQIVSNFVNWSPRLT